MKNYQKLSFEQLPDAVGQLLEEVSTLKSYLMNNSSANAVSSFITPEKEFLTVKNVSEILDLKISSIYQLIYQNKIPHYKKGGRLYFDSNEIKEWVRSGKRKTLDQIRKEARLDLLR